MKQVLCALTVSYNLATSTRGKTQRCTILKSISDLSAERFSGSFQFPTTAVDGRLSVWIHGFWWIPASCAPKGSTRLGDIVGRNSEQPSVSPLDNALELLHKMGAVKATEVTRLVKKQKKEVKK